MKKIFSKVVSIALIAMFIVGIGAQIVHANPAYVTQTAQTATATTSPAFMTPGTATSTVTFDSYNQAVQGVPYLVNKTALLMRFTGSSTVSALGISLEYSQDGIDWYRDFTFDTNSRSTTTAQMNLGGAANSMTWTFASSTVGGLGVNALTGATSTALVIVPTPVRYVRAVFSITGANGGIWAQFVPQREIK